MSYVTITAKTHPEDERIAHVRLDASERNNTIDLEMLLELRDAFEAADRDADVQGILLGNTGDVFCAGADVTELKALGIEDGMRWLTTYFETIDVLRETGKPVVAAVDGTCVAGGNELVMGCDLVVAGESARFGQPEARVGSTAAGGGVQLLPLLVGEKRARDLLLTGRLLEAEEARRIGLINRVVPDEAVAQQGLDLVTTIVDEKSPQAYRAIKAMLKPWTNFGLLNREMARDMTAGVWASEEFADRADTFIAREEMKPREFQGTRPPAGEVARDSEEG